MIFACTGFAERSEGAVQLGGHGVEKDRGGLLSGRRDGRSEDDGREHDSKMGWAGEEPDGSLIDAGREEERVSR